MLVRLSLVLLLLGASAALAQPSPGQVPSLADQHRAHGLTCANCHQETPPAAAVPDQVCIDCHGGVPAIIARTQNYEPNPHVSPHSEQLQCTTCHHGHKPLQISCVACHPDKTFVKP